MLLLEIVSEHRTMMGANARRVVQEAEAAEFTIGRLETCSWVLPQEYVSRVQAVVRCVNNMYFLERKGSTLLAINDRSRPIDRNRIVRLTPGDVILIDDIEILTSEVEAGYVPPPPEIPASPDALVAAGLYDSSQPGGGAGEDIMNLITGEPQRRPAPAPAPQMQRHSALDNVFDFGSPAAAAPAGGGIQPEEDRWWEDEGASAVASTPPSRPANPPAVRVPSPGRSERIEPTPPLPPSAPARTPPPGALSQPGSVPHPGSLPPPAAAWQPQAPAGADSTLHEILRGAGLDPTHAVIAPEVARQLGEILRLVVDGTMEMLKARNAIRRELRVPSTQLAPKRNNPLKFSADVDDALHKLFIQRAPAYLDTVTSFREAFGDIRRHQFALLKSVAVAFDHMLAKFDPKELERQMRLEGGRTGVLGLGGKPRQWEAYLRLYAEMMDDRDQAYRELFGDKWASAYETELRSPLPSITTDEDGK